MLFCQLDSDSAGVGDENCCCCRLTRLLRIIWVNACSEVWRQHYQHWSQGSGSHREHSCYPDDCPWPSSKVCCQFSRQAASRLSMKTTRTQRRAGFLPCDRPFGERLLSPNSLSVAIGSERRAPHRSSAPCTARNLLNLVRRLPQRSISNSVTALELPTLTQRLLRLRPRWSRAAQAARNILSGLKPSLGSMLTGFGALLETEQHLITVIVARIREFRLTVAYSKAAFVVELQRREVSPATSFHLPSASSHVHAEIR